MTQQPPPHHPTPSPPLRSGAAEELWRGTVSRVFQWSITALVALWLIGAVAMNIASPRTAEGFDLNAFGKLPVSYGGRFKPMDTVARNNLTILSGRQSLAVGDEELTATRWLTDVLATPMKAAAYPVFRIDHPEVKTLIGQADSSEKRFSYQQIEPGLQTLFAAAQQADRVDKQRRSAFQNEVLELASNVSMFLGLANQESIHTIPAGDAADWATLPQATQQVHSGGQASSVLHSYHALYDAYERGKAGDFNAQVASIHTQLKTEHPTIARKAATEWHFNQFNPFRKAMVLYVLAGLLVVLSWMALPNALRGLAIKITVIALIIHTAALVLRVYLSGRPPVTNLYSSAVFIGWGVVALSFIIEALLKRGLGLIVGVSVGFATLLIAQGLSADGDTMAVLQAVLDTNFWLATHVIVITLGYTAAFVAGALGILYVLTGVFTKALDKPLSRRLGQTIYGTVCFAVLLSFIGTILGGIWADQSWGRFWGWDPKENGALMIVLWNAIILHCRWGGLVRERGIAVLAILGNIVTSWSWFGVNMLGAGLHSYGFTDAGGGSLLQKLMHPGPKEWLLLFVFSQLIMVALGTMPLEAWRSHRRMNEYPKHEPAPEPTADTQPA